MDSSYIFIFSLDFSLELLVHIFSPLLNIYISLSKDHDIVMGIPQNAVVSVYKSLLLIQISV